MNNLPNDIIHYIFDTVDNMNTIYNIIQLNKSLHYILIYKYTKILEYNNKLIKFDSETAWFM